MDQPGSPIMTYFILIKMTIINDYYTIGWDWCFQTHVVS